MRYIYSDALTGEDVPDPEAGTYSIVELLEEHRQRYVLQTSKGAIVLRRLPWRVKRIIDTASAYLYPTRSALVERISALLPYVQGVPADSIDRDKAEELTRLVGELRVTDMYALGVIVAPGLASMDDLDALYDGLTEEEAEALDLCIAAMEAVRDPAQVDWTALEIAKAHGLQIMDPFMPAAMTVSQAAVLMGRIASENRRMERALGVRRV